MHSVIEINETPLRFTRTYSKERKNDSSSPSTIADAILCLDFSGSQSKYTFEQLKHLNRTFSHIGVYPFGSDDSSLPLNKLTTLGQLFKEYIQPNIIPRFGFCFPWMTSPLFCRNMFRVIPKDRPIQLVFNGDGDFSSSRYCSQTFIDIVREAKELGYFTNIVSFTIMFSENTPPYTRNLLEPQLTEILTSSDSLMAIECKTLTQSNTAMEEHFRTLCAENIMIPDGYLKFGNELYHKLLTPQSITAILKERPILIPKYTQHILKIFLKTPIVLISESNIVGKIYKALIALKQFNKDQFAIQLYFLDELSQIKNIRDREYDTRQRVYANFRKADTSNKLLMVARLKDKYSGQCILLQRDSKVDMSRELIRFGEAIRDGSHYKMCSYLTGLYNEHSYFTMDTTSSRRGFPVLKDDATQQDKIYSFGLIANLFGFDDITIGNSSLIVIAMMFLTNEYFDNDYISSIAELYLFSNFEKINTMLYISPSVFQNYMFSAPFSMLISNTIRTYKTRFISEGFTIEQLTRITTLYKVICKMVRSYPYLYSLPYRIQAFDFKLDDIYLISNTSWSDKDKEIPFPSMPCIGYIDTKSSSDTFCGCADNKVKFQYFEGDDNDCMYLDPKYLIRFSTNHTPEQFEAIKQLQTTLWNDYLSGRPSTDTYEQNFQKIVDILGDSYNTDIQTPDIYTGTFEIDCDTTRAILNFNSPINSSGLATFIKKEYILAWEKHPIETFGHVPFPHVT
jgi:hypothetical protein